MRTRVVRRSSQHPVAAAGQQQRQGGGQGGLAHPAFTCDGEFHPQLRHDELLLYLLLILVGNRQGMSFYQYDSLCSLLHMPIERYLNARNALIDKDLIAFDGTQFQVLELPRLPPPPPKPLRSAEDLERDDDATVRAMVERSFREEI